MSRCIWRVARGSEAPLEKGDELKTSKKPRNPGQVAKGNAEQATGEALGDDQLVTRGRNDHMEDNLKQAAEGVEVAFED